MLSNQAQSSSVDISLELQKMILKKETEDNEIRMKLSWTCLTFHMLQDLEVERLLFWPPAPATDTWFSPHSQCSKLGVLPSMNLDPVCTWSILEYLGTS